MVLVACGGGDATVTPERHRQIVAAVDSAMRAFADAERSLDAEAVIAHFDPSPEFRWYHDGRRLAYDSLVAMTRAGFPGIARIEGDFDDIEITVLGPTTALASARFRQIVTDTSGGTVRFRGAATIVWRRVGTGWRILYGDADHYPDEGG